jgi:hypothetical protein
MALDRRGPDQGEIHHNFSGAVATSPGFGNQPWGSAHIRYPTPRTVWMSLL